MEPREFKKRQRAKMLNAKGDVRGYHGGCPLTPRPFLGEYTLCFDDEGHIVCYGCGAHGLGAGEC